jgi:hypothetical protein
VDAQRRRRARPLDEPPFGLDALTQILMRIAADQVAEAPDGEPIRPSLWVQSPDRRVRCWALPSGFPHERPATAEATATVLAGLVGRHDGVALALLVPVARAGDVWPTLQTRLHADGHTGPGVVLEVAGGERRSTFLAPLLEAPAGNRLGRWTRVRKPLGGPVHRLEEALARGGHPRRPPLAYRAAPGRARSEPTSPGSRG